MISHHPTPTTYLLEGLEGGDLVGGDGPGEDMREDGRVLARCLAEERPGLRGGSLGVWRD
jgi:hypothetical protein